MGMRKMRRLALSVCVIGGAAIGLAQQPPAGQHWVATWGTAQQMYRAAAPAGGRRPAAGQRAQRAAGAQHAATRFGVPSSALCQPTGRARSEQPDRADDCADQPGGKERAHSPLQRAGRLHVTIGAAHIAIRSTDSSIVPGSDRPITFSGKPSATMYAGATLVSDPVTLNLPALADVAVSLYLPGETNPVTTHAVALHTATFPRTEISPDSRRSRSPRSRSPITGSPASTCWRRHPPARW